MEDIGSAEGQSLIPAQKPLGRENGSWSETSIAPAAVQNWLLQQSKGLLSKEWIQRQRSSTMAICSFA